MRSNYRDEPHRVLIHAFEEEVNSLATVFSNLLEAAAEDRVLDVLAWQGAVETNVRMARLVGVIITHSVFERRQAAEVLAQLRTLRRRHRQLFTQIWAYDRRTLPDNYAHSRWLGFSPAHWLDTIVQKVQRSTT